MLMWAINNHIRKQNQISASLKTIMAQEKKEVNYLTSIYFLVSLGSTLGIIISKIPSLKDASI